MEKVKLIIRKFIGSIWGEFCPYCGRTMKPQGYYDEKSVCPDKKCYEKHHKWNSGGSK